MASPNRGAGITWPVPACKLVGCAVLAASTNQPSSVLRIVSCHARVAHQQFLKDQAVGDFRSSAGSPGARWPAERDVRMYHGQWADGTRMNKRL